MRLVVKSAGSSSSQGTKGRLSDRLPPRPSISAKLGSRERSRLHPLREAGSTAPARVNSTVRESCLRRALNLGKTLHWTSGRARRRVRYSTCAEKQTVVASCSTSSSASTPTSSRLSSSQTGQAVVQSVSSSSNPKKHGKRGSSPPAGPRSASKLLSLSFNMWQTARTTSLPTVAPKTGSSSLSSPMTSPSFRSMPVSSSCSFADRRGLRAVSDSSYPAPPTSNGRFSYSPASRNPSGPPKPRPKHSSRNRLAATRSGSAFSWWMPRSKLQSESDSDSDSDSGSGRCSSASSALCLLQVVVFWLRILRDWKGMQCSSCWSTDINNFQYGTIIRAPLPICDSNSTGRQLARPAHPSRLPFLPLPPALTPNRTALLASPGLPLAI